MDSWHAIKRCPALAWVAAQPGGRFADAISLPRVWRRLLVKQGWGVLIGRIMRLACGTTSGHIVLADMAR